MDNISIRNIRLQAIRWDRNDADLWDDRLLEVCLRLNQLGIHATISMNGLDIDADEADWEWAEKLLARRARRAAAIRALAPEGGEKK